MSDRVHGGEPVRIALVLALTGIAAEDNRPAIRAAQLAVSEVNEAGGIHGIPLEMIVMDNGSTPLGSKRVAEEADKAGVLGVIGPLWSSHAMPMASVLQEAGGSHDHPDRHQAGDYRRGGTASSARA